MVKSVFTILLSFISIVLLMGNIYGGDKKNHGGNGKAHKNDIRIKSNVIAADFNTLKDCLATIEQETGSSLTIITDVPTQISGFLPNGAHFACVKKVTDEKGTYVDGWYTVK